MHVVLNMAASLDGRVAGPGGQPVRLSSEEDLRRVHRLRAASDAIVVGIGTVLADDPHLTARPDDGTHGTEGSGGSAQPLRVVVDSKLRTPHNARVLDEEADTLLLSAEAGDVPGARVHAAPGEEGVDLEAGFAHLEASGIDHVLVEGGPTLAAGLLAARLVDRFCLYVAPRVLGGGPSLAAALGDIELELVPRSRAPIGEGTLLSYGVPG